MSIDKTIPIWYYVDTVVLCIVLIVSIHPLQKGCAVTIKTTYMKNKIGFFLFAIGLLFTVGGPLYQYIDMKVNNVEGDGVESFGDNIIFQNILGVKKCISAFTHTDDGWVTYGTILYTPKWMQKVGCPKIVERISDGPYSGDTYITSEGYWTVVLLRWLVKLTPILLMMIGARLTNVSLFYLLAVWEDIQKSLLTS